MSKPKFKVGDRVKLTNNANFVVKMGIPRDRAGEKAVITWLGEINAKICFNDGYEVYTKYSCIKPINEKIIIYRNGAEVVAKNTATGKTGVAKCNPADEFDFNTGAKLAFDRLVEPEPEEPKYYSGKVVCIDNSGFNNTKGKIYKVLDGQLEFDSGLYSDERFKSVGQINNSLRSKFIELVE